VSSSKVCSWDGPAAWAEDEAQPWQTVECDRYGLHATRAIKTRQALYSKAGGSRVLTIVLTRDAGGGGRPAAMRYCTRLDWTALQVLQTYTARWAIETGQADSTSSDRWCEAHGTGYDPCHRAA
jgi:hypothetical protein